MEFKVLRIKPFLWFYFNIGTHEGEKRIAMDLFIRWKGKVRGISKEIIISDNYG